MADAATQPRAEQDVGSTLNHFASCTDPDTSMCGLDISDHEWVGEGDPIDCAVCADLEGEVCHPDCWVCED